MSSINFMGKLLDGVDVEWKALGTLGELVRGNGLQKKDFTETGVPAIHYGQIYTYYGLATTERGRFRKRKKSYAKTRRTGVAA